MMIKYDDERGWRRKEMKIKDQCLCCLKAMGNCHFNPSLPTLFGRWTCLSPRALRVRIVDYKDTWKTWGQFIRLQTPPRELKKESKKYNLEIVWTYFEQRSGSVYCFLNFTKAPTLPVIVNTSGSSHNPWVNNTVSFLNTSVCTAMEL